MHTHVHTNQIVETLTPTLVALLVETPERQIPRQGEKGRLRCGPPFPQPPGGHSQPSPDKLFAHGTEGRLPEEGGDKLVVLDVVNLGLLNGSTAVHRWEHRLVFTPQRLLAIWGPWNGEVSHSHSHREQPAVPPRWPWTDRWWGLLLYTSVLALASEPTSPAQVRQVLPPSSRKYCTDINTLAWGCRSSCRGEGGGDQ